MVISIILQILFLVVLPLLVVLLASLSNPVAVFLSDLFVNLLGKHHLFATASNIIQAALKTYTTPNEMVAASALLVISGALLEAAVIGTCIFFLKAMLANFSHNGALWYSFGSRRILSTHISTLGIILGTVVITTISKLFTQYQAILYAIVSISLMFIGIAIMWNSGKTQYRRQQKRTLHISNLVVGILVNMVDAVIWTIIVTSVMLGGLLIINGVPFGQFLQFYLAECVAYFIVSIVCMLFSK